MNKATKEWIRKIPTKRIRELYTELLDDLKEDKISTARPIYNIGWQDGWNARGNKTRSRKILLQK